VSIFPNIKHIAVIAPAGPAPEADVLAAVRVLQTDGARVTVMPHVLEASGGHPRYLAASVAERVADIHAALRDETVDLLLCARGGYGSIGLLPHLDFDLMRRRNLPLAGYSDITALHLAMLKFNAGRPWITPMAIRMERLSADLEAQQLMMPLFSPERRLVAENLRFWRGEGARLSALPVAANLAVMAAQCGTGFMPDLTGKILILEEVGEAPYRVDRYLTQLAMNGVFRQVSALFFGTFTNCGEQEELEEALLAHLPDFPPVAATGFPFGHGWPVAALDLTRRLELADRALYTSKC